MRVTLTEEQVLELEALIAESLREMSHEIAATDNSLYRARLFARRRTLEAVAEEVRARAGGAETDPHGMASVKDADGVWTATITFTEDEDHSRADVRMRAADRDWHGWGTSRRNPNDPDIPAIGEELSAARALVNLSDQLVDAAALGVAGFEGHYVRLHA